MNENKILILLNDKDPVLTRISKLKIEHETGWEAMIPTSFDDAIHLFSTKEPNIVVTEIILNDSLGRSGFDFIEKIKSFPDYKKSVLIVLTHLGQEDDIKKARELGVLHYFVKSQISIKDFIVELKRIVASK